MFSAVYNLSPVIIMTLIPARCSRAMVSGTPSCRRSSIPVAPMMLRWLYIYSTSSLSRVASSYFVIIFWRYWLLAVWRFYSQFSKICILIILFENTKVRRPSFAKEFKLSAKRE